MRRTFAYRLLVCLLTVGAVALAAPHSPAAQDVAITNVRVIVGSGPVIDSGTIVVRNGWSVIGGLHHMWIVSA